jgi:hypothetical protein
MGLHARDAYLPMLLALVAGPAVLLTTVVLVFSVGVFTKLHDGIDYADAARRSSF